MRMSTATIFALSTLLLFIQAAPFRSPQNIAQDAQLLRRRSVPYSVVPVDGGATSTGSNGGAGAPAEATTTLTTTLIRTPKPSLSVKTMYVTQPAVTFTPSPLVETVTTTSVVVKTKKLPHDKQDKTVTMTKTAHDHCDNQSQPAASTIISTSILTATVVETVTETTAGATTTVTGNQPPTTTKYYDNGQWHPPYPMTTVTFSTSNATATLHHYRISSAAQATQARKL